MSIDSASLFANLAACAPLLAIAAILVHYKVRRAVWSHRKSHGRKRPGFRPSSSALGNAFQFLGVLYRPSVAWVIEAKQEEEDAELDEEAERALVAALQAAKVDLIVLAGFMRVLKGDFLRAFEGRIVGDFQLYTEAPGRNCVITLNS